MSGWFSIKRGTLEHHDLAPIGKYSRFEAWVWLIENACFKPTTIDIGGEDYIVPRGALCHSIRFLADKWSWSPKSVRTFIAKMERKGALETKLVQKGHSRGTARTQLTLCNYDKYQQQGHSSGPERGTAGAQQGHKEEQGNNSVSKDTGAAAPPDPVKVMFDCGIELLTKAGRSQNQARSILGKWKRDFGTEAVMAALSQAHREGAVEPVSYLEASLSQKKRQAQPKIGATRINQRGETESFIGGELGWLREDSA